MKLTIASLVLLLSLNSSAQAFNGKGSSYTSIGWNISEINCWYKENGIGLKGRFSPVFHGISLQHEFGFGQYSGLSFSIGAGYARNIYSNFWGRNILGLYQNDYRSFVIPIGVQYNLHLFQWLEDRIELGLDTETWDGYIGFGIGAGPAFLRSNNIAYASEVGVAFFGDFQAGIRYYPKTNVGIYAQMGYGRSLLNIGVVFHK